MNKTPIEWTDFTVNPFRFRNLETGKVGHHCTKISPGCKNCYSSKMQEGPYLSGLTFIEPNKPKGEFFLDEGALQQVLRRKKPARIFWEDMSDMFLEDYPDEWIDRCFAVMALTPHLTHQVLTKRAERMREYFAADPWERITLQGSKMRGLCGTAIPMSNVHLGVSVEDQQRANERYEPMRALAAQGWTTWVSYEPALELVQWWGWSFLKWMVIGGESGANARPFDLAWARSAIAQCKAAGVACFVKQLGAKPGDSSSAEYQALPAHQRDKLDTWLYGGLKLKDRKGGDMSEWPENLRVREYPEVRPC